MAESQEKPTIFLIQGSFQLPDVYHRLTDKLQAEGFSIVHPVLPSLTDANAPDFSSRDLIDDALAIRMELIRLVEYKGKDVLVVAHSYGGLVGSEAITKDLTRLHRRGRGLEGGVFRFFLFAAFVLDVGQSVLGVFGEPPTSDVKPDGTNNIRDGKKTLYNDLPEEEASYWASRLIPQSHAIEKTQLTRAAYQYLSSTYLICENDQAIPVQHQAMFAAKALADVEACSAGHSPMLSQPDMLVEKITKAIEGKL